MKARLFLLILILLGLALVTRASSSVVINEICWVGTEKSSNDEWIELYNNSDFPINLAGWKLMAEDGTPKIQLSGTIPSKGFFLLERTDDQTLASIPADLIYKGALENRGEALKLFDKNGNLVDKADFQSGWPEGDIISKATMERSQTGEWQTSQNPYGTPRAENSSGKEKKKIPMEAAASQEIKIPHNLSPFLISIPLALGSGATILVLKKKTKEWN